MATPAKSGIFEGLTPSVTIVSLAAVTAIAGFGAVYSELFERLLDTMRATVVPLLGSYYIVLVSIVLVFMIWLAG